MAKLAGTLARNFNFNNLINYSGIFHFLKIQDR